MLVDGEIVLRVYMGKMDSVKKLREEDRLSFAMIKSWVWQTHCLKIRGRGK